MNETQLWYCDICDKTINFTDRLRDINSKSHKHKKEDGTVVKEYEFIKPKSDEVNFILNDTLKDRKNKHLHSFKYRCVWD